MLFQNQTNLMKFYKQKKSKINNRGLFASREIPKGTKIINYIGKIITKKQTENQRMTASGRSCGNGPPVLC